MRLPNAPARPKFSKALALTTVSTLALGIVAGSSTTAHAICSPSPVSGTVITCENPGGVNNTNINLTGGSSVNASQNGILMQDPDGLADVTNNGSIAINQTLNTANTIGINANDDNVFGTYSVVNNASITLTSNSRGQIYGIAGNGDAAALSVENNAHISIARTGVSIITLNALTLTATPSGNLAVAAGIFAEEELESLSIENNSTITASGLLSSGIYSRAGELEIVNNGTIANTAGAGLAIAAVSDSGILTEVEIENSGTITGDIAIVNGQALRWYGLSTGLGTGGALRDARLNINSQFGDINSTIENEGTISGNIYYGNGAHTIINTDEGTITGNIDVDQRVFSLTNRSCAFNATGSSCFTTGLPNGASVKGLVSNNQEADDISPYAASVITSGAGTATATYTYSSWGAKEFVFENAGVYTGNITVATANSTTIGGFAVSDSSVTIAPHIFGGGNADADDAVNPDAQAYIFGTLKIADGIVNGAGGTSSIARTTEIAPIIDSLVRSGEWYTVSTGLFGSDVPEVEGSGLVSWTALKNGSGALVIGSTVADASTIAGLSAPGIAAVNGLMNVETENEELLEFAGAIQNLSAADVRTAGEQLAPDTSFATTRAAIQLANLYGNAISNRLTGGLTGAAGAPGGSGFAPPSGLGMGSGEPNKIEKPMYLQGSNDETSTFTGREAAWAQAFGAKMEQDAIQATGAYDADVYGFMGGYDGSISPNLRMGVAFGYGDTSIQETGIRNGNRTNLESYNATVYAATRGAFWYLTGQLGYTSHDFSTQRVLNVAGIADRATGTHEGEQFTASGEIGVPLRMAGAVVTPVASLAYNKLDQDAYTERSRGGMAFAIGDQSTTSLVSGLGVRTAFALGSGSAFEARAIWLHEFEDTNQTVRASFATATNAFTSTGANVSADVANLGAGLNLNSGAGYTLQLNYDAYVSDDFLAHAGTGRVRVEF